MIEIKLNKKRILSSSFNTNEIYVAVILFCVYYTVSGRSKSIKLSVLNFSFDCIINDTEPSDYEFVSTWSINPLLKPLLVMLDSFKLIEIKNNSGKIQIHITENGKSYVEEMINENLFVGINLSAKYLTQKLTSKKFENQKLIW